MKKKKTVPMKQAIPRSEEAPPDASVEIPVDKSVGGQISNVSPITGADTFSHSDEVFPIVGIGASAGGLEKARKELAATKISEDEALEYAESIINTVLEPLIILNQDLRVVTASRSFYEVFKVNPEETVGQLIYDLGNKQWDIPKLRELLETILPQETTFDKYEVEHDFADVGRRIMLLNARQIQRASGKERIILLAIEDITARKEIEDGLEKTRKELAVIKIAADEVSEYAESVINTVREPLIVLNQDLRVVTASRSFYEVFKVNPEETVGQLIYDLGNKQLGIPKLRELLETILPEKTTFDNYEVEHDFADIGRRIMLLNARQIQRVSGKERIILLAIEDITERKRVEEQFHRQSKLLAAINSVFFETLTADSEETVANTCLKVAQEITDSKFGFIGEITPESLFTIIALSDPGWETCRIPEMQANVLVLIKDMVIRGIWGQVLLKEQSLIVNDPVSYPDRVGIPEGHPPLTSFLGVPLKDQGKVIGMIAMANRESGYTSDHQQDLEVLSGAFVEAIRRKQAEEEIKKLNAELEQRVIERTAKLSAKTIELEANRRQLTDIIEFLPDATMAIDKEGRIIIWNKAIEKMTGIPAAEMIGKGDYAYTIPFYGEARPALMELVFENNEEIAALYPNITREGDTLTTEAFINALYNNKGAWTFAKASPLHDQSGNIIGAIESIRDITARKRAEEVLRDSEEQYRTLVENIDFGVTMIDKDFKIIMTNAALVKWPNKPVCEIVGKTCFKEFEKRQTICQHCPGVKAMATGQPHQVETEGVRDDGSRFSVLIHAFPLFYPDGATRGFIEVIEDITKRKQEEEERKRLFKEVQASFDEMQRLSRRLIEAQEVERQDLARELHDRIGQNLTALSINLNIMRNQLPASSGQQIEARLDDSLKLLEEMTARVRDLMGELRPPVLDGYGIFAALRWCVEQFSDRTGVTAALRGKNLTPRLPLEVETGLVRIAQEALNNVVKHAHAKKVTMTLKSVAGRVRLTIADDGVGFNPQAQLRLAGQMNWGLLTMRERAHAIGGDLRIETEPGKGTKVIVEVPITEISYR